MIMVDIHAYLQIPHSSVVIVQLQGTGTVRLTHGTFSSASYYFRIFARDIDGNFSAPDSR
jgi:hypothetical protein